jgi:ubiquinone/menaquinone biosynthesis C-methylase UbiE
VSDKTSVFGKEREFHDTWAKQIDYRSVDARKSFSACTSPEPAWILKQLGDIKNKRVLELGTGAGEAAVYFAIQGANVTATDLSPGMLEVVKKVAAHHGVTVETAVSPAEDLSAFSANSFDVVYAANTLHHVDIGKCLDEVKRVLKPGGCGAFWDPLAHNPAINIYRNMANEVRTEDEHPISRSDMKYFSSRFSIVSKQFFWLTTLLIFAKFYLIDRIHPNSDRYWKRVVTHEAELRKWYKPLAAIDRALLTIFPVLGWWCWNMAIIVRKEDDGGPKRASV